MAWTSTVQSTYHEHQQAIDWLCYRDAPIVSGWRVLVEVQDVRLLKRTNCGSTVGQFGARTATHPVRCTWFARNTRHKLS